MVSEVIELRTTVAGLKTEMAELKEKCEDLEGRMRRCNIRIVGIAEESGSCSTTVSNLMKEVLHLEKDIRIDCLHRLCSCAVPSSGERTTSLQGRTDSQLPRLSTKVAKACAAFKDVRNLLRGWHDVRYGIIFPARLRISFNGDMKEFLDPAKAMTYVKGITAF
ncbi:hypothetical protein SRHO_G00281560 [Serrasalmus rhombeus]